MTFYDSKEKLAYMTGFGNEFQSCHPDYPGVIPQGQVSQ